MIVDILDANRTPIEQIAMQREDLGNRLHHLDAAMDSMRGQMEGRLEGAVRAAERPFKNLPAHLKSMLAPEVKGKDLRKVENLNHVEVLKTQVIRAWMAEERGPEAIWNRDFKSLKAEVRRFVRGALRESGMARSLRATGIDLDELIAPRSHRPRSRSESGSVVQSAAGFLGISTPVATGIAAALGIASGAMLLIPAGVTAGSALLYGGMKAIRNRSSILDKVREDWMAELAAEAESARELFIAAALRSGEELISSAEEIVSDRRNELSASIIAIEDRIDSPDYLKQQDRIERLEPMCDEGGNLVEAIGRLVPSS